MADLTPRQAEGIPAATKTRYRDMGDGTHALVLSVRVEDGHISIEDADGTVWAQPSKDSVTGAAIIVPYEHHEIHDGTFFHCWYEQTVSDTGDQTIIAFKTPVSPTRLHMLFDFTAPGAAHGSLLEAPTITDNTGAPLTVFNRERESLNVSKVWDTSQNPDVQGQAMYFTEVTQGNVTGGTELWHANMQAGTGNKPVGGEDRGTDEWPLKMNTLYAFVIESLTDDDNKCLIRCNWYEKS